VCAGVDKWRLVEADKLKWGMEGGYDEFHLAQPSPGGKWNRMKEKRN
jgi:hypothetical protein